MKNITLLIIASALSFCFGFGIKANMKQNATDNTNMKRVTGIGGIFFKCKDPKKMREWYKTHLGLNTNQYGTVFEWRQATDSSKKGFSQWSPFGEKSKY